MADYNEPYLTLMLRGIIEDIPPSSLPDTSWSSGQNIRFSKLGAEKFTGHRDIFGTPTVTATWGIPVTYTTTNYWVYAGHDGIAVTDTITHYDITVSGGLTATPDVHWNGTLINNLVVLNNQQEGPFWWNGATASAVTELPAWPANQTARVIRTYKNYLLAMDITISSTNYETMLHWSDSAPSGSVPASWDETDPTLDAGKYEFADTPGALLDGQPLGDAFIIYKRNSCYIAQFDGSNAIFRFRKLYEKLGTLNTGCVLPFFGQHLVLSADDLVLHDGSGAKPISVIDGKMREWLFGSINMTETGHVHLMADYSHNEIWVCFPAGASERCDTALVWNYDLNEFGVRELPQSTYGTSGIVDLGTLEDWGSDGESWGSDIYQWNQWQYNSSRESPVMFCPVDPIVGARVYELDRTAAFAGVVPAVFVERQSMPLLDRRNVKLVKAVYPTITSAGNPTVGISVGGQMAINDDIVWSDVQNFVVGVDDKVDVMVKGRYISIRFESEEEANWVLNSFDLEIELAERY
jgi:hypothetical protein